MKRDLSITSAPLVSSLLSQCASYASTHHPVADAHRAGTPFSSTQRVSHFMVLPVKSHCAQKTGKGRGGANQCGHRLTPGDASQLKELASPGGDSPGRSSAPTTAKRRQVRVNDVKTSCTRFQNNSFVLHRTLIGAAEL